jgi:hypothetical protein
MEQSKTEVQSKARGPDGGSVNRSPGLRVGQMHTDGSGV